MIGRTIQVAFGLFILGAGVIGCSGSHSRRPNIVLLMSDDQGWAEVGYNGHPHLETPVLDEMAASGLRFDRFYAAAPVCSPTRASVLTGRHPIRSGVFAWDYALRPEEMTLAAILKQAGYRTGHFGKWHLGPVGAGSPVNPRVFGFDEYLSHDISFDIDPILSRNGAPPWVIPGEGSAVLVDAAIRFIQATHDEGEPFLVVLWFATPHKPYLPTARDLAKYPHGDREERRRFAEISAMDRAIGRLRGALRELDIAGDTLLWFCSDNGAPIEVPSARGLAGGKGSLSEGGIRVPGIIEWPAVITSPLATSVPAVTSDILPTVLDLLGIEAPERPLDGVSLKALIEGGEFTRPPIGFWIFSSVAEAQNEPWMDSDRLLGTSPVEKRARFRFLNFEHPDATSSGLQGRAAWIDGRWKLLVNGPSLMMPGRSTSRSPTRLFDIEADPGEMNNLASQHSEVTERMNRQLRLWQAAVEQSLAGADYGQIRKRD